MPTRGDDDKTYNRSSSLLDRLKRHGYLTPALSAAAIYALGFTAVVSWLAMHGEDTTQRRLAQSPSITVVIAKPATPTPGSTVPRSEEDVQQSAPSPVDASDAPAAEDEAPLLPMVKQTPTVETETKKPVVPEKPDVKTEAAPTAQQTPVAPAMPEPVQSTPAPAAETPAVPTTENKPIPAATWQAETRVFDKADKRPRVAIIVTNLGLANNATKAAIQTLPANVTMAFQTIAPSVGDWIAQARLSGHEVLLAVPMEPNNYPQNDPGPQTLLNSLPTKANLQRLDWALARSNQIIGLMPLQGDAFVSNEKSLAPVLDDVRRRQLVFVDGTTNSNSVAASLSATGHIPFAQADSLIDATASRVAIDQALANLEEKAKANGSAVGIALPYPVTFERLNDWIKTLPAKNLVLAPVSAVLANTTAVDTTSQPSSGSVTPPVVTGQPNNQLAPTPAKAMGVIPRPKNDLSTIKRR